MSVRCAFGLLLTVAAPLLAQPGPALVAADTGSLPLLHRPALAYPREARAKRAEGAVILDLTVNAEGLVTDARVLSGPEELRKGALQSVLHWHYARPGAPSHVQVRLDYTAPAVQAGSTAASLPPGVLKSIELDPNLAAPVREALFAHLQPFQGKAMTPEASAQIADILESIEPHAVLGFRRDEEGNSVASIREETAGTSWWLARGRAGQRPGTGSPARRAPPRGAPHFRRRLPASSASRSAETSWPSNSPRRRLLSTRLSRNKRGYRDRSGWTS